MLNTQVHYFNNNLKIKILNSYKPNRNDIIFSKGHGLNNA